MHFTVLGLGAIGRFLAAQLIKAGYSVTGVARSYQHESLTQNGIVWNDERFSLSRVITSLQDLAEEQTPTLLLITTKAFAIPSIITTLKQLQESYDWSPEGVVLFQNGIGSDEQFLKAFPQQAVSILTTTTPVSLDEHSFVSSPLKGGFAFAQATERWPLTEGFPGLPDYPLQRVDNWRTLKWSKLLLNLTCNASCAVTGLSPSELLSLPQGAQLELNYLKELSLVIQHNDIALVNLPGYPVKPLNLAIRHLPFWLQRKILVPIIKRSRKSKKPSLQLALEQHQEKTEFSVLYNPVIQLAKKSQTAIPYTSRLVETFHQVEQTFQPVEISQLQPKRLQAER